MTIAILTVLILAGLYALVRFVLRVIDAMQDGEPRKKVQRQHGSPNHAKLAELSETLRRKRAAR